MVGETTVCCYCLKRGKGKGSSAGIFVQEPKLTAGLQVQLRANDGKSAACQELLVHSIKACKISSCERLIYLSKANISVQSLRIELIELCFRPVT